jgi:hypothetical protein
VFWLVAAIMGRRIDDQETTITVPLNGSDEGVVIDLTTMSLRIGHTVFYRPHIIGPDGNAVYLDSDMFREYLEQYPARLTHYCVNAQVMLVHLSLTSQDVGVIRMHAVPTETLQ